MTTTDSGRLLYSYLVGEAQAGIFFTAKNINDPDADCLTGQNQHKNARLSIYVLILQLPGLHPSHFWAVIAMTATGLCQLTIDKERYGMNSRLPILTGEYSYLDGEAQVEPSGHATTLTIPTLIIEPVRTNTRIGTWVYTF